MGGAITPHPIRLHGVMLRPLPSSYLFHLHKRVGINIALVEIWANRSSQNFLFMGHEILNVEI